MAEKFRTRIPEVQNELNREQEIEEARSRDYQIKAKQKLYKDSKAYVKKHSIQVGDSVLLKQKKTKMNPPYDPHKYTVTAVRGHQITATREGKTITRDAQKWKRYTEREKKEYKKQQLAAKADINSSDDDTAMSEIWEPTSTDQDVSVSGNRPNAQPTTARQESRRYPDRQRSKPDRYGDNVY